MTLRSAFTPALRDKSYRSFGQRVRAGRCRSAGRASSVIRSSRSGGNELMPAPKSITIVGGGLAGLTLGIGLRQKGIPVTVWEAGHYPRHRVCGEFISGRGQDVLTRLGLRDYFDQAGTALARTGAFYLGRTGSPVRSLPEAALCISRFAMDALLAGHFRQTGGELRENARWREENYGEGVVRANGRRLQPRADGCRWLGDRKSTRL